jgi:Domain of unknown function (DUF4411)
VTDPPQYVLDSNVFIESAKRYYAFDIAPAFWQALIHHARQGRIQSIDRVRDEIDRGNDELKTWAKDNFQPWFSSTDQPDILQAYAEAVTWVNNQSNLTRAAKAEFAQADNADAWVIAFGKAKRYVVVTDEQYDPKIRKRVKIPNVCRAFKIPYLSTFELLRELGVRLG